MAGIAYGVKDAVRDAYITGWISRDMARQIARVFNERYGDQDYREVEDIYDDPDEVRGLVDRLLVEGV